MKNNLLGNCQTAYRELLVNTKDNLHVRALVEALESVNLESNSCSITHKNLDEFPKTVGRLLPNLLAGINESRKLDVSLRDLAASLDWYQIFEGEGIDRGLAEG